MRKLFLLPLFAVGAMMLATSCSQDDMPQVNSDGMTTFTVSMPEDFTTRAFGDDPTDQFLYVAIYPENGKEPLFTNFNGATSEGLNIVQFNGTTKAQVKVNLVKGDKYDLVFWAQSTEIPADTYSFNPETREITVKYGTDNTITNFAENRDAFYKGINAYEAPAVASESDVELKRPFAQINILTDDIKDFRNASADKTIQFGMIVNGVSNVLNLSDDSVYSSEDFNPEVTISNADPRAVTETDYENYDYLDMSYFLVGDKGVKKENLTVSLVVGERKDFTVYSNIPAQMNFRTNIYGSLLTVPNKYNVIINPFFDGSYNGENGEDFYILPTFDDKGNTTISSPLELVGLSKMINAGDAPEIVYVNLAADMDMSGINWTPMGNGVRSSETYGYDVSGPVFQGVILGNGHTIKNLTIKSKDLDDPVGFIGTAKSATITDLKFSNVNIDGSNSKTVGTVVGFASTNVTLTRVSVEGGTVQGCSYNPPVVFKSNNYNPATGGLVGAMYNANAIGNCYNSASVSSNAPNVGGIAGAVVYTPNSSIIKNSENDGEIYSLGVVGGILGNGCAITENCTNNGVVTSAVGMAGGIVGEQDMNGRITDCTNNGKVITKGATNWGTGGIVGWLRYYLDPAVYTQLGIIEVSGCKNTADIQGGNDAGGIIGVVYCYCKVHNNVNTAARIATSSPEIGFAGGIVGNSTKANGHEYPNMIELTGKVGDMNISYNISTTPIDDIIGKFKDLYVYQNSSDVTEAIGNTNVLN